MLLKRFKEWITTLVGLALLAGAGLMLYTGKISTGEFLAFLPVCIGLIWAKNSFLTDIFKKGGGAAAFLIIAVLLVSSCRVTKPPVAPVIPPAVVNTSSTVNTSSGGTAQQGYTEPDSASIIALVACDSTGKIYLKTIEQLKAGNNVKPEIKIRDNYITLKCVVDSAQVWVKWDRFSTKVSDTVRTVQYLPGTVTNQLTWFQKTMVGSGYVLWAIVALFVILGIFKLKQKFI